MGTHIFHFLLLSCICHIQTNRKVYDQITEAYDTIKILDQSIEKTNKLFLKASTSVATSTQGTDEMEQMNRPSRRMSRGESMKHFTIPDISETSTRRSSFFGSFGRRSSHQRGYR